MIGIHVLSHFHMLSLDVQSHECLPCSVTCMLSVDAVGVCVDVIYCRIRLKTICSR